MIPDEIQRTIEFLLQHQANAAIRMDETGKQLQATEKQLQAMDKHLQATDKHIRDLSESTSRWIQELADSTSRQIRELTISTHQFQDDVKAFIKVLAPILEIQSKRLDRLEGHP